MNRHNSAPPALMLPWSYEAPRTIMREFHALGAVSQQVVVGQEGGLDITGRYIREDPNGFIREEEVTVATCHSSVIAQYIMNAVNEYSGARSGTKLEMDNLASDFANQKSALTHRVNVLEAERKTLELRLAAAQEVIRKTEEKEAARKAMALKEFKKTESRRIRLRKD